MNKPAFSTAFLGSLAAAGALAAGVLVAPVADASSPLSLKQQNQGFSVSGTAVTPEGDPAAKLPVAVKQRDVQAQGPGGGGGRGGGDGLPPPDLLQNRRVDPYKTLGKAVTDDSGAFTVRNIREQGAMRVEIGENTRTPWIVHPFRAEGKDVDVGKLELRPPVR